MAANVHDIGRLVGLRTALAGGSPPRRGVEAHVSVNPPRCASSGSKCTDTEMIGDLPSTSQFMPS